MPKISNIDKVTDISSGGKYQFARKKRKQNITIPLDPETIEVVYTQAEKYGVGRRELLRNMIEFASKNVQFARLMEQL